MNSKYGSYEEELIHTETGTACLVAARAEELLFSIMKSIPSKSWLRLCRYVRSAHCFSEKHTVRILSYDSGFSVFTFFSLRSLQMVRRRTSPSKISRARGRCPPKVVPVASAVTVTLAAPATLAAPMVDTRLPPEAIAYR